MGIWDRWWKRPEQTPAAAPPGAPSAATAPSAPRGPRAERPEITPLRRLGLPDGPGAAEAAAIFRALRASPDEGRAIDAVREAAAVRPVPEGIRVAAAAALVERGDREGALDLLAPSRGGAVTPPAHVLLADLHAERGELHAALARIERVLVVDLDYPGARERNARWRAQLGLDAGPAPAPHPDANGATVVSREPDAPFVLLREIARGGAGAVYEAEDRELGRRVALKVYHRPERDRAQLVHEGRVATALAGPGVVRVLDVDPDHGWLALEWAPLGSLRQRLRAGDPTRLASLERWVLPLAEALARVHAAGWVHHDVKPANVLLGAPDRPLLADFGSARRAGEPSPPGSLGYVSPERLAGRASDPRDDVFGFGRILEDTLARRAATPAWQAIAAACTGPDATRPSDARALVTRLRVETFA